MRLDENEFFRQATLRICGDLNIGAAMSRFVEYLKPHMPVSGMCLGLCERDTNIMRIIAASGDDRMLNSAGPVPLSDEVWDQHRESTAKEGPVLLVNDMDELEPFGVRFCEALFRTREVSGMMLSVDIERDRLGVIIPYVYGKNRYEERHVRMMALIRDPLAIAMANILRHEEVLRLKDSLADDNRFFQRQLLELSGEQVVGADLGLKGVMKMVDLVAPLDSPVLLLGETGVGKDVIANAIHNASTRRKGPFIKVNCGAIPMSLMDSELFGHEKGAFTGAIELQRGRFERADGGTIFLDEIGDLSLPAQVRLLRVLQTKEFDRVGGSRTVHVDVRVISATHRNLAQMVNNNRFREDLYYRLNVYPINIPPLRQREEDIPVLVQHFVERKSKELRIDPPPSLGARVLDRLKSHAWPGNVRELENWVERALIHSQGKTGGWLEEDVSVDANRDIPSEIETPVRPDRTLPSLEETIARHISEALRICRGRVEGRDGAATLLKMHPSTLRAKMRKLGLTPKAFKTI